LITPGDVMRALSWKAKEKGPGQSHRAPKV